HEGSGSPTAPRIRSTRPELGCSRYAQTSITISGGRTMGRTSTYRAIVPARLGMWVTISAAVNCDTRVIRMLPPVRIATFLTSIAKFGDWTYWRNWEIPAYVGGEKPFHA